MDRSAVGILGERLYDSGILYCELKELSYESVRRWIVLLKKEREREERKGALVFVEVTLPVSAELNRGPGVKLFSDGVEILVEKNFDRGTLSQVLEVRKRLVSRMSEAGLNRQKRKSAILSDRQQHCRAIDSAGENPVEKWGYREAGS